MYVSLPQGGTMLVLNIDDLTKVKLSLNLHTKPTETQRPPTKTNYSQISPTKPKEAQRDPFAMLYLCIVIHGKCAQSRTHPEGLALFLVNTKQPTNMGTNKQDKQPNN